MLIFKLADDDVSSREKSGNTQETKYKSAVAALCGTHRANLLNMSVTLECDCSHNSFLSIT